MIETSIPLEELEKYCNENNINLVLFAETHGFIEETTAQKEILKNMKFDSILYELLEDKSLFSEKEKQDFLSRNNDEEFSIISKIGGLKGLVNLSKEFNIPLIGCDLKNTGREDTSFRRRDVWTEEEIKKEQELMETREKHQYNKIMEFLNKGERIFVSIGLGHLQKKSTLMKSLSEKNFLIVIPCLKSGKKFGESMDFDKKEVYHRIKLGKVYLNED